MKVLAFDTQKCSGARECEAACAQTWFKVRDVAKSSIRISAAADSFSAAFCIQCGECIKVCPTNALYQNKQGVVLVKKALCVGCLSCVGFCPYGVMYFDTEQTAVFKCVVCGKCVETCPTGALSIVVE